MNLFFDGSISKNPGGAISWSWILGNLGGRGELPVAIGNTVNVAEYLGLMGGLAHAIELGCHSVRVFGDSQLVIRQMRGEYDVKADVLNTLASTADRLCGIIGSVEFNWIPRDANWAAHEIAGGTDIEEVLERWRAKGSRQTKLSSKHTKTF